MLWNFLEWLNYIDIKKIFVASIVFESQEGFASYLGSDSAMEVLRQSPLMEVHSRQRDALGVERATESLMAQLHARGLGGDSPVIAATPHNFHKWAPKWRNIWDSNYDAV